MVIGQFDRLAIGRYFSRTAQVWRDREKAHHSLPAPITGEVEFERNVGYRWMQNNSIDTVSTPGPCTQGVILCNGPPSGSLLSAQTATFSLPGSSKGSFNPPFPTSPVVQSESGSKEVTYLGTVRGRLGVLAAPSVLVYATGGLAYGGVKADTSITQSVPVTTISPYTSAGEFSSTRAGYTVGGGAEWMFLRNMSAKLEYLYYDLGSMSYSTGTMALVFANTNVGGTSTGISTTRFNGNVVRDRPELQIRIYPGPGGLQIEIADNSAPMCDCFPYSAP